MRRLGLGLVAAALVAAPAALANARTEPLGVGDRAPDFVLIDQHGRPVRLSDLLPAHRYVVLAFYVKAFTPG